jgi:hypothetical protein
VEETDSCRYQANQRCPTEQHSKQDTGSADEGLAFDHVMLQGGRAAARHVCQRTLCDHILTAGAASDENIPDTEKWYEVKQSQPSGFLARLCFD